MAGNAPERYRLVFSDIRNFVQSVLSISIFTCLLYPFSINEVTSNASALGLNHEVTEGRLKKGVLVKLTRVEPSVVKGRKYKRTVIFDTNLQTDAGAQNPDDTWPRSIDRVWRE